MKLKTLLYLSSSVLALLVVNLVDKYYYEMSLLVSFGLLMVIHFILFYLIDVILQKKEKAVRKGTGITYLFFLFCASVSIVYLI
ncbi:hypothetical protein JOC95_002537 [Bacillus tianshenii]|uniref:Uncharacterized protein n=1 Tax=Sutcliffiella tianshenii TaxID=1463404 RepID=A0ABS2P149_9BACI|nr:hypothetical protein [Bacillus tianshenii]MBM7620682.1 hypothetical protein [Bacillus tianshenii]